MSHGQAEIINATREDPALQRLEGCLRSGKWPAVPELRPFYPIRSELSLVDGLVEYFLRYSVFHQCVKEAIPPY